MSPRAKPKLSVVLDRAHTLQYAIADLKGMLTPVVDEELSEAWREIVLVVWERGYCLECEADTGAGECIDCDELRRDRDEEAAEGRYEARLFPYGRHGELV